MRLAKVPSSPQSGAGSSGGRRGKNGKETQQEYCEGACGCNQACVCAARGSWSAQACFSRPTASGSAYAGLVTAARAFTIFLLAFAILPSSPTASASPALRGARRCRPQATICVPHPLERSPETVVLMTVQGFPLDTSLNHNETAREMQTRNSEKSALSPFPQALFFVTLLTMGSKDKGPEKS